MMVWGLIFPSTFGAHSPDGNFEAFKEQLSKYFEKLTLEEQILLTGVDYTWLPAYINYVFAKLTNPPDYITPRGVALAPIQEHEWPTEFALEKRHENLAALIKVGPNVLLVEEALKNIIERLEPGVHQFRPITITMPRGAVYPAQYYTMVIGQWLDSFVPEMSDPGSLSGDGIRSSYHAKYPVGKSQMAGLAFSANQFGNSHLWRERKLSNPQIFMSHTLHGEIITAGLRLPKHFQMKEV